MFMNFLSVLLWEVYPGMVMHHEQCIFIMYDSAGTERKHFLQQSKLIEL